MSIDRPPSPTPGTGAAAPSPDASGRLPSDESRSSLVRLKRMLFGGPKDIEDRSLLHRLSLVAFLAWIGLGADALSSSAYGPEEAFKAIGHHRYLALGLALATAGTVFVISAAYSKLIENFPNGGGYGVARAHAGRACRRGQRLRAARRLRADHHHLDRGDGRRHLQLPAAVLAAVEVQRARSPPSSCCSG